MWTPDPLLVDELDVDERGGTTAHVQPDGTVFLNRYYRGSITGSFDLHEFPLDHHDLEVALEASDYETDEVVFAVGEVRAVNQVHVVPHGWKLLGMAATAGESKYARTNETFSLLKMTIQVTRDPHFYFWSIVLPLIPIMATAWSVFWMDPKEFSSQVGVGITAMLTVVAYRITIDSSLPPLTYMTRMDYFLIVCQTFVFLAFVSSVSIHVLYALDVPHMRARAARLTELSRWLPPVVLVIVSVLLAVLPVRFDTFVILAPAVLAAIWLRGPLLHLPHTLRVLVRPELLLETPEPHPAESSGPHGLFRGRARWGKTRQRSQHRLRRARSLPSLQKVNPILSRLHRVQSPMGAARERVAIAGGKAHGSGSGFHVTVRAFLGHVLLRHCAGFCSRTSGRFRRRTGCRRRGECRCGNGSARRRRGCSGR